MESSQIRLALGNTPFLGEFYKQYPDIEDSSRMLDQIINDERTIEAVQMLIEGSLDKDAAFKLFDLALHDVVEGALDQETAQALFDTLKGILETHNRVEKVMEG